MIDYMCRFINIKIVLVVLPMQHISSVQNKQRLYKPSNKAKLFRNTFQAAKQIFKKKKFSPHHAVVLHAGF